MRNLPNKSQVPKRRVIRAQTHSILSYIEERTIYSLRRQRDKKSYHRSFEPISRDELVAVAYHAAYGDEARAKNSPKRQIWGQFSAPHPHFESTLNAFVNFMKWALKYMMDQN